MSSKLIVLMVDGVAAEHYQLDRGRFPFFTSLETRGFRVERLHSEVLGTSLPGRTSMLTGVTADISGVYGNKIWDGTQFRYANPDDVRVPTLPARAKAAGKDVATIGFGMIRPEDTTLFRAPWWTGRLIQRARDVVSEPADESWLRAAMHQPGERFHAACAAAGVPSELPPRDELNEKGRVFYGMIADHVVVDWAAVLAISDTPPDLIMAEFGYTDTMQHATGYRSLESHWSLEQADLALGKLLQRLRAAGVEDDWNIAVLSDHGHSAVELSLHPSVIIPGVHAQCEGGCLLVAPKNAQELDWVTERLAAYHVELYPNTCVPSELRDRVFVFVAPAGVSFEDDNPGETEPTGRPNNISTHGMRPGMTEDDRFALFAGPNVPVGCIPEGDATQVAPTLAALLGLSVDSFPAQPLFQPRL